MKKCMKCGFELTEDGMFCAKCGTKVENVNEEQKEVEKQETKKKVFIGGIGAAGIALIAIIIMLVSGQAKVININDYMSVSYSGYETYGVATIEFDTTALKASILENGIDADNIYTDNMYSVWGMTEDDIEEYMAEVLIDTITATADADYGTLSNGDEIVVSITYDESLAEDYGVKFKTNEEKFVVSDLGEITTIDPFADIELMFTGASPAVNVEVVNNSTIELLKNTNYIIEATSGYAIGDVIEVTIDMTEEMANRQGYSFTTLTKEYTCENVDRYVTSIEDLNEENLASLQEEVEEYLDSYLYSEGITTEGYTFEGTYCLYPKESTTSGKYILYLVYSVQASYESRSFTIESETLYLPVYLTSVIVTDNETLSYNASNMGVSYVYPSGLQTGYFHYTNGYINSTTMYDGIITANKAEYEYSVTGNLVEFGE